MTPSWWKCSLDVCEKGSAIHRSFAPCVTLATPFSRQPRSSTSLRNGRAAARLTQPIGSLSVRSHSDERKSNNPVTFSLLHAAMDCLEFQCAMISKTKWLDPMKTSSVRAIAAVIAALFLTLWPTAGRAATVTVMVGPNCFCFSPSSVTINPGDTVRWTFSSSGHSTTSGSPGAPNGIWDSGILNQGAMFTHTFNSAGSFPYFCTPHGSCCGMVGSVTVVNASPTPTATPPPSTTTGAVLDHITPRSFVQYGNNVMIGGFIVQGSGTKRVIIRAIGPELGQFGVPDPLQDPTLELHDGNGTLIASNDNWQTTIIGGIITHDQVQDIMNSGPAPVESQEPPISVSTP